MLDLASINLACDDDCARLIAFLRQLADRLATEKITAMPEMPSPAGIVYGHAGTNWPPLGAATPVAENVFTSKQFLSRFEPGEIVHVYAAGCAGLRTLASIIDLPLRKVGATRGADVRVRIADLSRDQYGSGFKIGDDFIKDAGFENYFAGPILCGRRRKFGSPVSIEPRSLAVQLPKNLTFDQFECRLQNALLPTSLNDWISSPDGVAHLERLRLDPRKAYRFSEPKFSGGSPEAATELQIFRPRVDGSGLVAILERIVLDALGLK
jgi:hypothetical protein